MSFITPISPSQARMQKNISSLVEIKRKKGERIILSNSPSPLYEDQFPLPVLLGLSVLLITFFFFFSSFLWSFVHFFVLCSPNCTTLPITITKAILLTGKQEDHKRKTHTERLFIPIWKTKVHWWGTVN